MQKRLKKPYIEKKDKLLKSGGDANFEKTRNESNSRTLLGLCYAKNGSEKQFRIDKIFNGRFWLIC